MTREEIGTSVVHFPLKKEGVGVEENLLSSGVDFPLSNTCQFFSLSRGEEDGKIIAAKKRMKGERVGGTEEGSRRRGVLI